MPDSNAPDSTRDRIKQRLSSEARRIGHRASRVGKAVADRFSGDEDADEVPDEVKETIRQIDETYVRSHANDVTEDDVKRVVESSAAIEDRFESGGPLGRFVDDGRLLLAMVKDYWTGTYRALPPWTLTATAFTLLYVLNPLDLIPDTLPFVGVLDDATVVSVALLMIEQDLHAYKQWRSRTALTSGRDAALELPASDADAADAPNASAA